MVDDSPLCTFNVRCWGREVNRHEPTFDRFEHKLNKFYLMAKNTRIKGIR